MALDGITVACIADELNKKLAGGKINKIYQPQKDEIIMNVRCEGETYKVLLSANPSCPRVHISDISKENPVSAPLFSMVLRKHLSGGKIIRIFQPGLERITIFTIETFNEMGDISEKELIIEIMGKHSNIILLDSDKKILDSIKRISHETSSIREVLPGKNYFYPPDKNKLDPFTLDSESFLFSLTGKDGFKISEFIYKTYVGISPVMASEISFRAGLVDSDYVGSLSLNERRRLFNAFKDIIVLVKNKMFSPEIILDPKNNKFIDFSAIRMFQFGSMNHRDFKSISELLEEYYLKKNLNSYISSQTQDIRHIIKSNIERCVRKKEVQKKTLNDIKDMYIWKLYGNLITSNIYLIEKGVQIFNTINYYDENMDEISIPLDPTLTANKNAQKYFNKYNKAKRTLEAIKIQEKQNDEELSYLESLSISLENAIDTSDVNDIKSELKKEGYIKSKSFKKEVTSQRKSKPMHFLSSDGFEIFVGKSNTQNDELTLKFASQNDIWLHTKDIPGSHVIIKTDGKQVPDKTIFEAASLSAYFSKGKLSSNVPVDYTLKKHVKKPSGSKPGMVIYNNNKTMYVTPDEKLIESLKSI